MHFAVIGSPIGHSKSPELFEEFWTHHPWSSQLTYRRIEVMPNDIAEFLAETDLAGFNVTLPLKEAIVPWMSTLSPAAKAMGAVNTVVSKDSGWEGHNTDAEGFWEMLAGRTDLDALRRQPCLVLGNGGAARAVVYALAEQGFTGHIACRTPRGGFPWPEISYDTLTPEPTGLVVQCTSLGMHPSAELCPPLPPWSSGQVALAVDLVYNPTHTLFMQRMEELGTETLSGEAMLRHQAKKAWIYWAEVLNIPHI